MYDEPQINLHPKKFCANSASDATIGSRTGDSATTGSGSGLLIIQWSSDATIGWTSGVSAKTGSGFHGPEGGTIPMGFSGLNCWFRFCKKWSAPSSARTGSIDGGEETSRRSG